MLVCVRFACRIFKLREGQRRGGDHLRFCCHGRFFIRCWPRQQAWSGLGAGDAAVVLLNVVSLCAASLSVNGHSERLICKPCKIKV